MLTDGVAVDEVPLHVKVQSEAPVPLPGHTEPVGTVCQALQGEGPWASVRRAVGYPETVEGTVEHQVVGIGLSVRQVVDPEIDGSELLVQDDGVAGELAPAVDEGVVDEEAVAGLPVREKKT